MFLLLLVNMVFAGTPVPELEADEEIVVDAHVDYEVYVAPIKYHVHDDNIEAVVPYNMIFNYTGSHSKNSKVKNERGTYEPITMQGGMKVYNKDTIKYTWDNCNYLDDYRKCSYENNHYFLETHVTVDSNELTISVTLFDSDMQVVSTSQRSNQKVIKWIKQQEIKSNTIVIPNGQQSSQNCVGVACNSLPQQNNPIIITNTEQPKEEKPIKWEIPHRLLSDMVYQVSIGAWTGVKIN